MQQCPSVSLVSEGAEAVLISKKFFLQHLTDDMIKRLRMTVSEGKYFMRIHRAIKKSFCQTKHGTMNEHNSPD